MIFLGKKNLKYYLKDKLTEKELSLVPTSFDVVGDLLIFADFPKELVKKEKMIGNKILEIYRHIKVVLKKTKNYSGKFRTPKLKVIAGEKRKETVCKENDVFLKLDAEKVYFSPRMSGERKRIAQLVMPKESVLVMFSGCCPYPLVIAKNSHSKEVYGIEINPLAHKYALENIKKNRMEGKVHVFLGDVKMIVPKLKKRFDRILMPFPKKAEDFLETALRFIKKNGTVHFYDFLHENELDKGEEKILAACKRLKKICEILETVKCGQYAPGAYRVCIDFTVK